MFKTRGGGRGGGGQRPFEQTTLLIFEGFPKGGLILISFVAWKYIADMLEVHPSHVMDAF